MPAGPVEAVQPMLPRVLLDWGLLIEVLALLGELAKPGNSLGTAVLLQKEL